MDLPAHQLPMTVHYGPYNPGHGELRKQGSRWIHPDTQNTAYVRYGNSTQYLHLPGGAPLPIEVSIFNTNATPCTYEGGKVDAWCLTSCNHEFVEKFTKKTVHFDISFDCHTRSLFFSLQAYTRSRIQKIIGG